MRASDDSRPTWLRWLHRIGYITTLVVLAEIAFVGMVVGGEWLNNRAMRAKIIEETRTHDTPVLLNGDRYVRKSAVDFLGKLRPLSALNGDGLRFVAMPSFGTTDYGLVLFVPQPGALHAKGVLTTVNKEEVGGVIQHREFVMPVPAYRTLMARIDSLTDGWSGDARDLCADGTPAAFERVRGRRVTSGIGNCSDHYKLLKSLLLSAVRQFAPGDDLPTEDDWHRFVPDDR